MQDKKWRISLFSGGSIEIVVGAPKKRHVLRRKVSQIMQSWGMPSLRKGNAMSAQREFSVQYNQPLPGKTPVGDAW